MPGTTVNDSPNVFILQILCKRGFRESMNFDERFQSNATSNIHEWLLLSNMCYSITDFNMLCLYSQPHSYKRSSEGQSALLQCSNKAVMTDCSDKLLFWGK